MRNEAKTAVRSARRRSSARQRRVRDQSGAASTGRRVEDGSVLTLGRIVDDDFIDHSEVGSKLQSTSQVVNTLARS